MPASAFLLAFAAAWIHGVSNVFVGRRQEPEAAFAFMLIVGVIAFAPIARLHLGRRRRCDSRTSPRRQPLELGYFAFLAAGYRISEVSLIYPVARGAAPILVLVGAVLVLRHGTTRGAGGGRDRRRRGDRARPRHRLRWRRVPTPTGSCSRSRQARSSPATRSSTSRVCTHAAPIPYIELALIGPAVVYSLAIWRLRGAVAFRREATWGIGLVGVILVRHLHPRPVRAAARAGGERLGGARDERRDRVGARGGDGARARDEDALRRRRARGGRDRARRTHVVRLQVARQRRTRLRAMKSTFAGRSARRRIRYRYQSGPVGGRDEDVVALAARGRAAACCGRRRASGTGSAVRGMSLSSANDIAWSISASSWVAIAVKPPAVSERSIRRA